MPFVRQRPQRLCEQPQLRDPHRELPGLGPKQHAGSADDVAQIPGLEALVCLAQRLRLQVDLNLAAAIGKFRKTCATHHAPEQHAAADPHGGGVGLEPILAAVAEPDQHLAGKGIASKVIRISDARFAYGGKL